MSGIMMIMAQTARPIPINVTILPAGFEVKFHGLLSAALAIVDNVVMSKAPANKILNFIEFFTLFTLRSI